MMSINLSDIAILNIKGADYRCIINGFSKSEALNLMQFIDLTEVNVRNRNKCPELFLKL